MILSLDLGESNLGPETKKYYKRFKQEMKNKEITAIWSTIDSKSVRDSHDRWIMDENGYLRNVPNVNAISSGQRSEISVSENYDKLRPIFEEYWRKSKEITY